MLIVTGFMFLVVVALWFFAILSWFESREMWNSGVCPETGKLWIVREINGVLHLDNTLRMIKVGGIVTYSGIIDALHR